ncbi:MAG TPA: L,D-transpeptidase [Acidimicrobiales bacterium]|nr:L,D-transpeptidase [Acidimicrobiales bacterium]
MTGGRLGVMIAAAALLVGTACSDDGSPTAAPASGSRSGAGAPEPPTSTTTAPRAMHVGAVAMVPKVAVFATPDDRAKPVTVLSNPTFEHVPLAFRVIGRDAGWLHVQLNVRPNGSTGWIRAADVNTHALSHRIVVELATLRLRVFDGDELVMDEPVAIGRDKYPTPRGQFFVDAIVHTDPKTVWGPMQISVSGFSDVLKSFGGGGGQIAIHGTNQPQLVGKGVSHGCVRMQNDAILRLAAVVGLGTPVEIR